ncbi:MAG: hypothetical protein MJ014_04680, partial [Methanocorpusculum sp.]|nr:hypothetical protein [Methanocorpusculum sp.]
MTTHEVGSGARLRRATATPPVRWTGRRTTMCKCDERSRTIRHICVIGVFPLLAHSSLPSHQIMGG